MNAVVTLLTSDAYLPGALVTLHSLLDAEGPHPQVPFETVCLVTPATVSVQSIKALRNAFSLVVGVEQITSVSTKELALLGRPDLATTLTKLHLFRLVQFRKVLFLDADTLVLQPLSHLFNSDATFSAAPDSGWPDCFNSGMFVATPNAATFDALVEMSEERGSWDGGDQGLLNDFYPAWNRLSFAYNVTPTAYYTYAPAYRRHGSSIKMVHFIGTDKPWRRLNRSRPPASQQEASHDYATLVDKWYDVYERHYGQVSTASMSVNTTFSFPKLSATWDQQSTPVAYQPPSFEELKRTFSGGASSSLLKFDAGNTQRAEGHYVGMPLAQRPDFIHTITSPAQHTLSPPLRSPVPTIQVSSPSPPKHSPQPEIPPPQSTASHEEQHGQTWNPAVSEPPKHGRGEMEYQMPENYQNVWESDSPTNTRFFQPPKPAPIPENVGSWYDQVTKAPQQSPDAQQPVFPWQESANFHKPTRVFPESPQSVAPPLPKPASPLSPSISPSKKPPGLTTQYTNAWDAIPGVQRYADTLYGRHSRSSSQVGHHSRNASDPSHKRSMSRTRKMKEDYERGGEASSRDGDDEDDSSDDEETRKHRPALPLKLRPGMVRHDSKMLKMAADIASPIGTPLNAPRSSTFSSRSASLTTVSSEERTSPSSSIHASPNQPPVKASRVFDAKTDTELIREEGMQALSRFIKSMEAKGREILEAQGAQLDDAKLGSNKQ